MEDVLYDYHLAQAMIEQLSADERDKMSQAYIDAVFEKNNITEEEFDSSLVYYNRNSKKLNDIYQNVQQRLEEENQALALSTGNDVMTAMSQNGDTTNIWNSSNLIVLRSKEGLNHESFTITADSSFHRKDKFILNCNPIVIQENTNESNNYINIGLSVRYKDGEASATTMRISNSRFMQLYLSANEDKDIASVDGFFYYSGSSELRNIGLITSVSLVRMHTVTEVVKPEIIDTIKHDSIVKKPESIRHEHLSPEQMRKQNQSGSHINIKAAPDVRTPNSIGPRRRIAKPASPARRQN